ncbi:MULTISPECIES: ribosome maturation factor RimM [unclassified Nitratiruptor]|uniref:ribosome maturation factor RimM n=1 Tax=unclassified Nitratiruptor TaxID=2624044 RepID=UPI0019166EFF|nr:MULTISPECIES: ribosome maturation factor RimM [unclassified Nitratiruptor]BCD60805.1 16S rRNA processing protein RimM [Nitratiruptor sp. YY08-10]BCD64737.1 16S rRNA processing protein RimM [Nitratiruptor sp. YY08-14]
MKKLTVARLGRTVGLHGDMKLHILTDFPEQFQKGSTFESDRGSLTIESVNPARGTVKFQGIDSVDEAKKYTNAYLYSDEETTKKNFSLNEDEYFWFDVLGCDVFEEEKKLGKVVDIQRLPAGDYLVVQTDRALVDINKAKTFLIPFLDRFIENVDIDQKRIDTKGAQDILEAS